MPAKCRKVPLAQRSQSNDDAYTPTEDQVGGDCLSFRYCINCRQCLCWIRSDV